MKRKYVIAGNYCQFENYLRLTKTPRRTKDKEYIYIYGPDKIRGIIGKREDVIRFGTYYKRDDIAEIEAIIDSWSMYV